MRNLIVIVLIISGLAFFIQCKPSEEVSQFGLTAGFVTGNVKVVNGNEEKQLQRGQVLGKGEVIISGERSYADVLYGNEGVIRLNENSRLEIAQIRKVIAGSTMMNLQNGKVFVSISKLAKGSVFGVRTKTTLAAVRGTSFRVSALEKRSRIDVIAGKVKVNPVKEGRVIEEVEQVVEENQTVSLTEENVQDVVEKKKAIEVVVLEPEVAEEIRQEIKAMPVQVIKALPPEVKQEIKKIQKIEPEEDNQAEIEEQKKAEAARRALARKQQRNRELAEQQERENQARIEQERRAKELAQQKKREQELAKKKAAEAARKKKEEEERAGNIPSL